MITEDHLEQLCLTWFQDSGWEFRHGPAILERQFHKLNRFGPIADYFELIINLQPLGQFLHIFI